MSKSCSLRGVAFEFLVHDDSWIGQQPGDIVYAEKLREDAIRAQDWEVVRWAWPDLDDFAPTAARIRQRFRTT